MSARRDTGRQFRELDGTRHGLLAHAESRTRNWNSTTPPDEFGDPRVSSEEGPGDGARRGAPGSADGDAGVGRRGTVHDDGVSGMISCRPPCPGG